MGVGHAEGQQGVKSGIFGQTSVDADADAAADGSCDQLDFVTVNSSLALTGEPRRVYLDTQIAAA